MAFPPASLPADEPPSGNGAAPTSILVYARTRGDLDPVLAEFARRVDPDPVWIEITDTQGSPSADERPSPAISGAFARHFEFEPSEFLPDDGRANLLYWGAGRPAGESSFVRELEDLAWLPQSLMRAVPEVHGGQAPFPVVLARAELLVTRLPNGVDDVARLLRVLETRRITLIVGLLFRPFPEFSRRFQYVYRVRPAVPGGEGAPILVQEWPAKDKPA